MAKPIDTERRQKIVQYVMSHGKARVAELAEAFNVSGETIRKDLNELHNRNILHKGHGIVLPASAYLENVYARKAARHQEEKSRIAALAESLIPSEGVIYLDASSTVARLASLLARHRDLTIITNSMSSAQALAGSDNQVMVTGGELRHKSYGYIGQWAERAVRQVRFDIAFFGCDGFHGQGPAIRAYPELAVKECALAQADKRILLADSSKLEAEGLYCFATFRDIDLLICDRAPTVQEQTRFPPGFTIITPES
ncbi:DeoR/GlpR family DNA-binding transcription regulator [Cardiobacterium hominis]|uniref:DeoR/GlpR family DNA-binding transcription regulator n=1 Tax=Cardiobacterium hominis TaxID=2718 RepID=UPI0028EF4F95|nr:DeoR/GlpR family DNA-binding transcription regulator [Cardiobacterium hominis]